MTGRRLAALLAFALALFLLPVPDRATVFLARSAWSGTTVLIVGNSVIDHVSRCDSDKRNLAAMIAARTGLAVADASAGGQSLLQSERLARMAIGRSGTRIVVLTISANSDSAVPLSIQNELFFAVATGTLDTAVMTNRVRHGAIFTPSPAAATGPFQYRGKSYPDYAGIGRTYFAREKRAMPCPENSGRDRAFIDAYHLATFSRGEVSTARAEDAADLQRRADERGVRLIVAVMPMNLADTPSRDPNVRAAMVRRRAALLTSLRRAGVDSIDLTQALPPNAFSDRWCACGHLGQAGRAIAADRIARAIG